jgi:hypothetical protein
MKAKAARPEKVVVVGSGTTAPRTNFGVWVASPAMIWPGIQPGISTTTSEVSRRNNSHVVTHAAHIVHRERLRRGKDRLLGRRQSRGGIVRPDVDRPAVELSVMRRFRQGDTEPVIFEVVEMIATGRTSTELHERTNRDLQDSRSYQHESGCPYQQQWFRQIGTDQHQSGCRKRHRRSLSSNRQQSCRRRMSFFIVYMVGFFNELRRDVKEQSAQQAHSRQNQCSACGRE